MNLYYCVKVIHYCCGESGQNQRVRAGCYKTLPVRTLGHFLHLLRAALEQQRATASSYTTLGRSWTASMSNWFGAVTVKIPILGYAAQGAF
jgi:hypothetical protein